MIMKKRYPYYYRLSRIMSARDNSENLFYRYYYYRYRRYWPKRYGIVRDIGSLFYPTGRYGIRPLLPIPLLI